VGNYSEIDEKVDVYALGLILLELSCNIGTIHEKYSIFESLRENHKLDKRVMDNLKDHSELDLIMALTINDPKLRPSAERVRSMLMPKWERQL
jgi:serine/threonine protein kinase